MTFQQAKHRGWIHLAIVIVAAVKAAGQATSSCTPACQHGVCQQQYNSRSYFCNCTGTGYSGVNCSLPAVAPAPSPTKSSPCNPTCLHGTCKQGYNTAVYICDCFIGYDGSDCAHLTGMAPGTAAEPPSPCEGGCLHGTCSQAYNSKAYACTCDVGYKGRSCDSKENSTTPARSSCSPSCQNGGMCAQAYNSQAYYCKCDGTRHKGIDCTEPLNAPSAAENQNSSQNSSKLHGWAIAVIVVGALALAVGVVAILVFVKNLRTKQLLTRFSRYEDQPN